MVSLHPMTTGSTDRTRRAKTPFTGFASRHPLSLCVQSVLNDSSAEPTCFSRALKFSHWRNEMIDEFNALIKQKTWSLVPASIASNVVGCK